jgi:uncharacterized protein
MTTPQPTELAPCLADHMPPRAAGGWLDANRAPLAAPFDDEEGERLPASLPEVVDAHVHLFPDAVFEALWRWFEKHAWPVRYKLYAKGVTDFLFSRGVSRIVALHYAHRPGMSRPLNQFMAALCQDEPRIWGLATVLPGEEGAAEILKEAFAMGLRGVKLHCHVQCFSPDDEAMHDVYEACVRANAPLVVHAGREPKSPAYKCDPYVMCSADRVGRVLEEYPGLRLCVPHLGADEFDAYEKLLERHDNLWLDTTMTMAEFFTGEPPVRLVHCRPERVLYGTDFPNVPYAWDREFKKLAKLEMREEDWARLLGGNALALFGAGVRSE